jgi:hypothetical protein
MIRIHLAKNVRIAESLVVRDFAAGLSRGIRPAGTVRAVSLIETLEDRRLFSGTLPVTPTALPAVGYNLISSAAAAPVITRNTGNQTVSVGGTATFSVVATGTPAPSYQWQSSGNYGVNWNNLTGATSSSYSLIASLSEDQNEYRVLVSNSVNTVVSSAGKLTVLQVPATTLLAGTIIGTTGSYKNFGNTAAKALDGSLKTFFDAPTANGNWVGIDLGVAQVLTSVAYASRSGYASRMNGGIFQASNSPTFASDVNLYTIGANANPSSTALTTQSISNTTPYRYVRYLAPAGSYGNIAELQFFGHSVQTLSLLGGNIFGTAGSYRNDGHRLEYAEDANITTFFDAPTADGDVVGLDFGSSQTVQEITFAPRAGYAYRMVGGVFQASNTADFSSGVVDLYTVTTAPVQGVLTSVELNVSTQYRYVRYVSPDGGYGNVAEIAFYS